jgi:hypothetical protein
VIHHRYDNNVFVKITHTWSLSRQPYPWLDAQELTVVRDDMKFLNADDKSWILSKTVERVWPFGG